MAIYTLETSLPQIPLAHSVKIPSPHINFKNVINPESALEADLIEQPEFKIGLNWGAPRFGHPEGKVGFHVREVLDNIDKHDIPEEYRRRLRLTAIAHDTFKFQESATIAAGKRINHGLLARRFVEKHIDDKVTLELIELHDEIYYAWRCQALYEQPKKAAERLEKLFERIEPHLKLHYLFFRCDTMTGDKIQAPRIWLDQQLNEMLHIDMSEIMSWLDDLMH